MSAIYYLGNDCPKCGSYRVLPVKKNNEIRGYCLECAHEFASERTGPKEEEEWERLEVKSARRKEVNNDEEGVKDEDV